MHGKHARGCLCLHEYGRGAAWSCSAMLACPDWCSPTRKQRAYLAVVLKLVFFFFSPIQRLTGLPLFPYHFPFCATFCFEQEGPGFLRTAQRPKHATLLILFCRISLQVRVPTPTLLHCRLSSALPSLARRCPPAVRCFFSAPVQGGARCRELLYWCPANTQAACSSSSLVYHSALVSPGRACIASLFIVSFYHTSAQPVEAFARQLDPN